MAKIRNMGTATMKYNEGIIVSGTVGNDTHSLVVDGGAKVTNNFTVSGDGGFDNAYIDDELVVGTVYNSLRVSGSAFLSSSNDVYSGDGSGDYSVSLWYKSADQVNDNRIIFTLANSNARSTVREKGGGLQFLISNDDNTTLVSTINYYPDEAGNWNFLTFVSRQNGTSVESTGSLNGAITTANIIADKTVIKNYASNNIRNLQIAGFTANSDTIGNEMFIRDFILWDGSLSADDITTLYNGGNPYNFRNFTTYDKLAWLKPDQINETSFDGSSSSITNHGSVGGIFEVVDYDVGEIVEVNTDAPFTDPTGNSLTVATDALIHGDLSVSTNATITGNIIATGSIVAGAGNTSIQGLTVNANISGDYAALIDNDQSNQGHGLKVTSDGTGAQTNVFDVESVSNNLFRIRGDGRVGIGTTSPTTLFHVDGATTINTNLHVSGSTSIQDYMIISVSADNTDLQTGTGLVTFRAPFAMTLYQIPRASLSTNGTSQTTVDINVGGTTIMTTNKLTIDANEGTSTSAATAAVLTTATITDDQQITIDVDAAGTGARGLKVTLYYRRNL